MCVVFTFFHIFSYYEATKLPDEGEFQWRLQVLRYMMWESFQRDAETDEETRLMTDKESFESTVNIALVIIAVCVTAVPVWLLHYILVDIPRLQVRGNVY